MKKISILGATGSIGQNTLDLISSEKENFKVVGLTGAGNIDLLAQDAIDFGADIVATADESKFSDLKDLLSGHKIEVCAGSSGVLEVSSRQTDWVMSAIVGSWNRVECTPRWANKLWRIKKVVAAGPIMKRYLKSMLLS